MEINKRVEKENMEISDKRHAALLSLWKPLASGILLIAASVIVDESVFYAEPGYIYHVRTVTGGEEVVAETGYKFYPFGRYNAWKRAMTVESVSTAEHMDAEDESSTASATLPSINIMFLDQVDANAESTVRFSIPTDEESFLKLAAEYRTPENLLRTALIPAVKETKQATASLMSAEEYYSGGRSEFNADFERQLSAGLYIVNRKEVVVGGERKTKGSANAAKGDDQDEYSDDSRTIFIVEKKLDANGLPVRKVQKFTAFGITVADARITDMNPNDKFVERMQLKQKASTDRAIAREQRIQEEEQHS
jgi:regulator of protease activity HflC (stomatin/prohibitin superfamily)